MHRTHTLSILACLLLLAGAARPSRATSHPGTFLILPHYEVEPGDPQGKTTLWAVRNLLAFPLDLTVQYYAEDGSMAVKAEFFDLAVDATVTRNLRDVAGIPAEGWVLLTATLDGSPSAFVPEAIQGDFFWLEPGDAFASGGGLLRDHVTEMAAGLWTYTGRDLCRKAETRLFNGGAFSGGTDFVFFAKWDPSAGYTGPLAVGSMYDETGTFLGTCSLGGPGTSTGTFSTQVNSALLAVACPALPTFGTIRWEFAAGVVGHVTAAHRASGLYSVSVPGSCISY